MSEYTQMEKYDIVIILCPSPLNKEGKFDELSPDLSYLGGLTRMQAAADISSYVETFIVVGGGCTKVNDMKSFLEKECKNLKYKIPKIIRIESRPDTNGNLRAIRKAFVKFKSLKDYKACESGL